MQLKLFIAKNALLHFYRYQYWTTEEYNSLQHFCEKEDSDGIWKAKLRLLCEENNDVIVAAVLADLTPEEQIFLYEKFRLDYSFVKIGLKLNIHPNGLQRWRDKILSDIASLMNYKLPIEDIFSRNKIEALIFSLERIISFQLSYGRYDSSVLKILQERLSEYQRLLFIIRQCIELNSDNIGIQIIRMKILNPNITAEEVARCINVSHTTVDRYINLFKQKFYPIEK